MSQAPALKRFHLRIELKHVEPLIWREVVVPADISLGWLHEVIQITMGWTNSHLHEFEHKRIRYGQPMDEDFIETIDEDTVPLDDLFKRKGSRLTYAYDFGDGWEHNVSLVKTLNLSAKAAAKAPPFAYIGGARACPPEDCGGPWGYQELLDLLQLRKDKGAGALDSEQLEQLEWMGDFEPATAPAPQVIERQLGRIEKWLPEAVDENEADFDGDSDAFDDFMEFMAAAHKARDREIAESTFDPSEDEKPVPEPYSTLSADEAGVYARSMKIAAQVRDAEPWKQLHDCDIFGIEDPETGELDIVSVLGGGGEVFSIHVHRPPCALHFWRTALINPESMTEDFVMKNTRMVEVEFVNKRDMEPHDLQLYTQTAIDTPGKGRRQWIRLRTYAPRILPQFGHLSDLPALDRGLRLCLQFLQEVRQLGGIRQLPDPATESLPVFRLNGGSANDLDAWKLTHIPVDWGSCPPATKAYTPSEFEIAKLASYPKKEATWELGSVYLPTPVTTEDGPVICIISVVASREPGAAPPVPHLDSEPDHNAAQALWNCLAEAVDNSGFLPTELHVSSDHAYKTLVPLAEQAGLQLKQFERCDLVQTMLQMIATIPPPNRG